MFQGCVLQQLVRSLCEDQALLQDIFALPLHMLLRYLYSREVVDRHSVATEVEDGAGNALHGLQEHAGVCGWALGSGLYDPPFPQGDGFDV